MLVLRGVPLQSKHNLSDYQQQTLETDCVSQNSWSKNNRSRICGTFKIVLFSLSKTITNSVKHTDVIDWTEETHDHHLWYGSCVEVHVFATSFQLSYLEFSASCQDWMLLYEIHFRHFLCKFIQLSFWIVWILFKLPSHFWTWTNVHEAPGLELSDVSCISFRILRTHFTCLPVRPCEDICISFIIPTRMTQCGQVSWVNCCPSSPWPFRIIDIEHNLVRLCARKYVECQLISGVLIAYFPRHRTESEKTWTSAFVDWATCLANLFYFARFETVTRSARGCPLLEFGGVRKTMIAKRIQGK